MYCCVLGCSPWKWDSTGFLQWHECPVRVSPSLRWWELLPWQRSPWWGGFHGHFDRIWYSLLFKSLGAVGYLKKDSYHQGCIYLIKNTVKTGIILKYFYNLNFFFSIWIYKINIFAKTNNSADNIHLIFKNYVFIVLVSCIFYLFYNLIKITQLQFDWDELECTMKNTIFENC